MVNNVKIAIQLGYLDITQDELLTTTEMESLPPNEVVIVATGSQGEPTSAMVRMSIGEHRQITPCERATRSSSAPCPSPATSSCSTVQSTTCSARAWTFSTTNWVMSTSAVTAGEDYRHMLELVRPKYFIPVHGEYRHLVLHARLARDTNVPEDNTFVLEDGQVMEFGRFDHNAGEIVSATG